MDAGYQLWLRAYLKSLNYVIDALYDMERSLRFPRKMIGRKTNRKVPKRRPM